MNKITFPQKLSPIQSVDIAARVKNVSIWGIRGSIERLVFQSAMVIGNWLERIILKLVRSERIEKRHSLEVDRDGHDANGSDTGHEKTAHPIWEFMDWMNSLQFIALNPKSGCKVQEESGSRSMKDDGEAGALS